VDVDVDVDVVLGEGLADVEDDIDDTRALAGCWKEEDELEDPTGTAGAGSCLELLEDNTVFVIFFSGAGDAGATPLGRALCFARSARARFMVLVCVCLPLSPLLTNTAPQTRPSMSLPVLPCCGCYRLRLVLVTRYSTN
jgi:hypothetical protein